MSATRVSGVHQPTNSTFPPVLVVLVVGIALSASFILAPAQVASSPVVCPFRLSTGLPCPGCGLVRSWVALAHGDLVRSLQFNWFGPAAMLIAGGALVMVVVEWSGRAQFAWVRSGRVPLLGRAFTGAWVLWAVGRAIANIA